MIPQFNRRGYLPAGIHPAHEDEVFSRFCSGNPRREELGINLRKFLQFARSCGIARFLLDGSFVTDKTEPADYDCIIVVPSTFDEDDIYADLLSSPREMKKSYSADAYVVNESDGKLLDWWIDFFGTDRSGYSKGIVEVAL